MSPALTILAPIFCIEIFTVQFFIVYVIFLISINNSLYYSLLYIFVEIILFGLFICLYQMELFTGFLWVAEFTIVFIAILLLFYLNVDGLALKFNTSINVLLYYIPSILVLVLSFSLDSLQEYELFTYIELNIIDLFDDYYEAFNNNALNDFIALTISYYSINGIEFIIIGLLLLLGSLACINIYKSNKNLVILKQSNILDTFDFFKDFINFSFIRKQDLNNQSSLNPSLRYIKKIN